MRHSRLSEYAAFVGTLALILAVVALLSGCATIQQQRRLNTWKGAPYSELKEKIGKPAYWTTDEKYRTVAVYEDTTLVRDKYDYILKWETYYWINLKDSTIYKAKIRL